MQEKVVGCKSIGQPTVVMEQSLSSMEPIVICIFSMSTSNRMSRAHSLVSSKNNQRLVGDLANSLSLTVH